MTDLLKRRIVNLIGLYPNFDITNTDSHVLFDCEKNSNLKLMTIHDKNVNRICIHTQLTGDPGMMLETLDLSDFLSFIVKEITEEKYNNLLLCFENIRC